MENEEKEFLPIDYTSIERRILEQLQQARKFSFFTCYGGTALYHSSKHDPNFQNIPKENLTGRTNIEGPEWQELPPEIGRTSTRLYCEHCSARDGESGTEYLKRNRIPVSFEQSAVFFVQKTLRGWLCQYCMKLPTIARCYSYIDGIRIDWR